MNPIVDTYINNLDNWKEETQKLREIALGNNLDEELKWGKPCYSFEGSNIAIIQGFKNFCALMFFKGSLLDDPQEILEKPGKNTQAARRVEFTNINEIIELETVLSDYIGEAIDVEKEGLEVEFKDTEEYEIPDEFQKILDDNPALEKAFQSLTPGRQRAYLLYFSDAKQSKTRTSRVERYIDHILDGKGLND